MYSSPMTSFVLTDSSQLTSDSQHLGSSIKCWVCRSDSDPKCSDPFDNSTVPITDCKQEPDLYHYPNVRPTMCRKIRQKESDDTFLQIRWTKATSLVPGDLTGTPVAECSWIILGNLSKDPLQSCIAWITTCASLRKNSRMLFIQGVFSGT
uniref:(California timema) hypothetical protein n=1 Tax=Timema californicum TaxID=61474 RepID=A0A7R9PAQ3_TIMCA|nr:unnamed protein product [Timema californicum]